MTVDEMNEKVAELQNAALESAATHIKSQNETHLNIRVISCCLAVLLFTAMVCATVLGCYAIWQQQETIREQQYALNMQSYDRQNGQDSGSPGNA